MPRPRFSEMLVERRRQLGLSITQASKILRLKEQALIAFEEGDFENRCRFQTRSSLPGRGLRSHAD